MQQLSISWNNVMWQPTERGDTYTMTNLLHLFNLNSWFWAKRYTKKSYIISSTVL